MNGLATRIRNFTILVTAGFAALALVAVSPRFGAGTEWHRARHVLLQASNVNMRPTYVRFRVISSTRGELDGNQPDGSYFSGGFSREFWLHPQEKLTIKFTVGVNDVGNVVSCIVQTENGVAAHDRHAKKQDTRGPVPNDAHCNTSVVNS